MRKLFILMLAVLQLFALFGCSSSADMPEVAATTLTVYEFTSRLCQGTNISVARLITESISCLHDYTLQVSQIQTIEAAQIIVTSGVGLEDFLSDIISSADTVIDASENVTILCREDDHGHNHEHDHGHSHDQDPHIWLSPANAKIMAQNICAGLTKEFPEFKKIFSVNLQELIAELEALENYGVEVLAQLSCRKIVTFHDGFAYFADAYDLTILRAVEEESGSEASASELKELITLVKEHELPALFIEQNGSVSAASVIAAETGADLFVLDMAMSGDSYFKAMYHNINTVKEALE